MKRADFILPNPVGAVRLKAPKAYPTKSAKALTDEELRVLVETVKAKADNGEVVGKRDYAMLLLYLVTGLRREEIAQLKWGEVKIEGMYCYCPCESKVATVIREVRDSGTNAALLDCLRASR